MTLGQQLRVPFTTRADTLKAVAQQRAVSVEH
jgi:hypothetical protein